MTRARMVGRGVALLFLALLTTALFGAAVRVVTGLSLSLSTVLALPIGIGVAWLVWPARPTLGVRDLVVVLVTTTFALVALGSFRFGPLVGFVGGDAGVHVQYQYEFVRSNPYIYLGFVSFYAVSRWFELLLRGDAYEGFTAGFLLVVAIVGGLAGWSVRRALDGKRYGFVTIPVALVMLCALALPALGYFQTDGFFSQIFVLVPLAGLWLADAAELSRVRRAVLIVLCVVVVRYTYGLVLGDLVVFMLALVVREAVTRPTERRVWIPLALVVSIGVVIVERRFLLQVDQVVGIYGWFITHDFPLALRGLVVTELGLVAVFAFAPPLRRLLFAPLVISITNTVMLLGLVKTYGLQHYYLRKYDFHAVVLLSLASGGALVYAVRATERRLWVRLSSVVLVIGLAYLTWGNEPMRVAFDQRATGYYEPYKLPQGRLKVQSLVDTGALRRMRRTLAVNHAHFGGYLVAWAPMFNFVNALWGRVAGGYFHFEGVDRMGSSCVFWSHREGPAVEYWEMPKWMRETEQELDREAGKQCEVYTGPGDPRPRMRELCSVCFPAPEQ